MHFAYARVMRWAHLTVQSHQAVDMLNSLLYVSNITHMQLNFLTAPGGYNLEIVKLKNIYCPEYYFYFLDAWH